jgi:8-oxo-dGTP pyrophosphatase MutT (NUDIX family)
MHGCNHEEHEEHEVKSFPMPPRYASTIVLVRADERGTFDILLTRRPPRMRFLGGVYVFPGGAVHESDYSSRMLQRCRGLSGAEARQILGGDYDEALALGHWVAGIRELFEEVGILLATRDRGDDVTLGDGATTRRFETGRRAILREELEFGEFLESEGLYCDLRKAIYFYHRVTPEFYPTRFNTRFYLARLPADQTLLLHSEEVSEALWLNPAEALARASRRDFPLLPPTTTVLEDLSKAGSWDRLSTRFPLL